MKKRAGYNLWDDENFVAEMKKRSDELISGQVKGIPWEDAKKKIVCSFAERKKSNKKTF